MFADREYPSVTSKQATVVEQRDVNVELRIKRSLRIGVQPERVDVGAQPFPWEPRLPTKPRGGAVGGDNRASPDLTCTACQADAADLAIGDQWAIDSSTP